MKTLAQLQADYKAATTRTEQDRLLVEMHNHPDKGLKLIYDGRYVTVYQKPLGSLVLRPTNELFEEFRNPVENSDYGLVEVHGDPIYPYNLGNILEDWLCNSEYELVSSFETGDLISSDCPLILKDCDRNDEGEIVNFSDKWYFSQYAVRNEYYDLYQGALHLDKA
jgi:hypothetical protein